MFSELFGGSEVRGGLMPVSGCVWRLLPSPPYVGSVPTGLFFRSVPLGVCPARGCLFPAVAVVAIVCCVFGMAGFLDVRCRWLVAR